VVAAGAGWWSWLQHGTRAAAKVEGEWWRRHWKGERVAAGGARERGRMKSDWDVQGSTSCGWVREGWAARGWAGGLLGNFFYF